MHVSGMNL